jgi:hypothetical protein
MTELGSQFSIGKFVLLSFLGCLVLLPTWEPVQVDMCVLFSPFSYFPSSQRRLDVLLNRGQGVVNEVGDIKKKK